MLKKIYTLAIWFILPAGNLFAQEILPGITVKNFNGKIIVSWKNEYPLEVKTINIQRSFDSLKNYTTIGSVINPQSPENGFVDETPPYNKMYYRVFISFDAGAYIFSESVRPVKEIPPPLPIFTQETVVDPFKKADALKQPLKDTKKDPDNKTITQAEKKPPLSAKEDRKEKQAITKNNKKNKASQENKNEEEVTDVVKEDVITYPSRRIYTARDNNVVINLSNAESKKYVVKFFDEGEKPLFELNRIKEDFLILEKVNFLHAGWFYFEISENGKTLEKNKFFISKDGRGQ